MTWFVGKLMDKKLFDKDIAKICKLYLDGKSSVLISRDFNVASSTIRRLLKKINIAIRSIAESKYLNNSGFKYKCNELFFDKLNELSCYWAGFIAADGYIGIQKRKYGRRYLSIELSRKDKGHLEYFKEHIGSTHPIGNTIKKCCKIKIFSNQLALSLKKNFNIVNCKTFIYHPPKLKDSMMSHFIRGYIDGDGCIKFTKKSCSIEIKGTYSTLELFKDYLVKNTGCNPSVKIGFASGCRTVTWSGKQCFDIYKWLDYKSMIRMERKWGRIDTLLHL
jgi:hypothetical protein